MGRPQRLMAVTLLAAMAFALAGCSGGAFDPTDMMDWFDTKKKIPGERRPVFPEGVPGVEQGVPKELYKGAQQLPPDQPPVADVPPAPEPRARGRAAAGSDAHAAAPSSANPFPKPIDEAGPAPKMKRPKRTRITAPPPDPEPAEQAEPQQAEPLPAQTQSSSPFPAPLPGGSFSR